MVNVDEHTIGPRISHTSCEAVQENVVEGSYKSLILSGYHFDVFMSFESHTIREIMGQNIMFSR